MGGERAISEDIVDGHDIETLSLDRLKMPCTPTMTVYVYSICRLLVPSLYCFHGGFRGGGGRNRPKSIMSMPPNLCPSKRRRVAEGCGHRRNVVVSLGMAGQIHSCDSMTYPARSPGAIRGRRHGLALRGGDLDGEEIIVPSSRLDTLQSTIFCIFQFSIHSYVRVYVNMICSILSFLISRK